MSQAPSTVAGSPRSLLVVSDFNSDVLRGYLDNDNDVPRVRTVAPPMGAGLGALMDPAYWAPPPDYVLVWTRPEAAIPSFAALREGATIDVAAVLADVASFCQAVNQAARRTKRVFVPTWTALPRARGRGSLAMRPGVGVAGTLLRMNLALVEGLDPSLVTLLDGDSWLFGAGPEGLSPKKWYLGKIPFGNAVWREATRELKAAMRGVEGRARKLVILDLDDTLWGGTVGDVGWEGLRLGGHDPVGEAHVDFQRALRALQRRGVLLAVVSKNDEATALEAMRRHPEMLLRPEDLVGWRINWQDKAQNVADLVASVRLGLDAVVFIDDNPRERGRLREALPEVLVPEWPEDPLLYRTALEALLCFDTPTLSQEDTERTRLYAEENARAAGQSSFASHDEWLLSLGTEVSVERLDDANRSRVAQLLNKTNQLNLRTRRLSEAELVAWASEPGQAVYALTVTDRFGNAGLTGVLGVRVTGTTAEVEDFVLSCRVMGRRVEETMVHVAALLGREAGAVSLRAAYLPTPKNGPCREFLLRSGLRAGDSPGEHVWDLAQDYPLPPSVTLRRR